MPVKLSGKSTLSIAVITQKYSRLAPTGVAAISEETIHSFLDFL